MSDPTDPGGVTGSHERGQRNSTRVGDSGSPVGSPLTIVLAVIAVVAGFLIFRSISDDDGGGVAGPGGGGDTTLPVITDPGGAVVTTLAAGVATPTATVAPTREGAIVVVANSSGANGAADDMKAKLAEEGYTMGTSETDSLPSPLEESIVYFSVGGNVEGVARQVALDMGGIEVQPMPTPIPVEDLAIDGEVLVMLGTDLAMESLPGPPPSTPSIPSTPTSTTQPA